MATRDISKVKDAENLKKSSKKKSVKQVKKASKKTTDNEKLKTGAVQKEAGSNISKAVKDTAKRKNKRTKTLQTFDGHPLTSKEAKFIDYYIETGNIRQSVIQAGFQSKSPGQYGNTIMNKSYIMNEIDHRMTQEHASRVASGNDVMEFFTRVMNGEEKDQFGLDAPLSERIKAGQELAKRTVDIANKIAGVTQGENEVTIKLDWERKGI